MRHLSSLILILSAAIPASAAVTMPVIFGDHMVLQQDKTLPVWGWADPGEKVTVTIGDKTATVQAGADRAWRVDLPALRVNNSALTMTVAGTNTLTFSDVLVGDVWLCSGQSNMQWAMGKSHQASEDVPTATDQSLRLFAVPMQKSLTPLTGGQGHWEICSPTTVPSFSAVAYYFAKELRAARKVPIGVIGSYWGGTPAQAWTSQAGLEALPPFQDYLDAKAKIIAKAPELRKDWPERQATYQQEVKAWKAANAEALKVYEKAVAVAKAAAQSEPTKPTPLPEPKKPVDPEGSQHTPTVLFNAMINPLVPYAITGAIWYQGESNAGAAKQYGTLFPRMITDWRNHFAQGDFPFLFVQLANFRAEQKNPVEGDWAWLRQSQTTTLTLPNTGMAVAIDIGNGKDIHPTDKLDVGKRLALAARHIAYGENLVYSGPVYQSLAVDGKNLRLSFTHADGLKIAAPPWIPAGAPQPVTDKPSGFAITGDDGQWQWADATIDGSTIMLTSPHVATPVAAAYGWANNPACNIYNGADLPMVPFCTDLKRLPNQPEK